MAGQLDFHQIAQAFGTLSVQVGMIGNLPAVNDRQAILREFHLIRQLTHACFDHLESEMVGPDVKVSLK